MQQLNEIKTFLEAQFGSKPAQLFILIWTLFNKKSTWFRGVADAVEYVQSQKDRDVYVGVGLSPNDFGSNQRCKAVFVSGIVGIWADLDLKSEAHPKTALPTTVEEALQILPVGFLPTFVIRTGNGVHVWWLFHEPLIFESDEERRNAEKLVLRWQTLLAGNAAAHGWAFDRLADLSRVLRIPGTVNCKDPANKKPVEIHSQSDRRYDSREFLEYLDQHSVPLPEDEQRSAKAIKENNASTNSKLAATTQNDLVINPSAALPEDLLGLLLEADPRFQKTWLRQREDLKDQSQSGYDMALADFASSAGLSEQETVDLIVQHRRIHNQRQRNRLDYFQRTIAKASSQADGGGPIKLPEGPLAQSDPSGQNDAGQQPTKDDSAAARALLCGEISNLLGIRILRILKITGKEPTYQIELDIAKIEFANVNKLVEQRSFRMAVAAAADRLIPKIKPKIWDQIAQMLLDALTVEDGGEETDFVGAVRIHLENYLSQTPFIDSIADQPIQTRRKPTVIDGRIAICSSDFQSHLNKTNNENHSIKAVASMLTALGASSTRIRSASLRDQSRWLLPLAEFAPDQFIGTHRGTSDG
jgi:hypothetical protein